MINDMSQFPLQYASPYQVSMATSISRHKLENLIKAGIIKAKRIDAQTVLIEWDSVERYINSLPDVALDVVDEAPSNGMKSFNDQRRQAMDLFPEAQQKCE
jgi:hypothetical protein